MAAAARQATAAGRRRRGSGGAAADPIASAAADALPRVCGKMLEDGKNKCVGVRPRKGARCPNARQHQSAAGRRSNVAAAMAGAGALAASGSTSALCAPSTRKRKRRAPGMATNDFGSLLESKGQPSADQVAMLTMGQIEKLLRAHGKRATGTAEEKLAWAGDLAAAPLKGTRTRRLPQGDAAAQPSLGGAAAAAADALVTKPCIRGCGCVWRAGAPGRDVTACVFGHKCDGTPQPQKASLRKCAPTDEATEVVGGVACTNCLEDNVCPTPGCMCRQLRGATAVDRGKCELHSAAHTEVECSRHSKQHCGCCERICVTCGCREYHTDFCRARCPPETGKSRWSTKSAHDDQMGVLLPSPRTTRFVCPGCAVVPMCVRCAATATHRNFCLPERKPAEQPSIGAFNLHCSACVRGGTMRSDGSRASVAALAAASLAKSTQEGQEGDPKVSWASLDLVQWGALYLCLEEHGFPPPQLEKKSKGDAMKSKIDAMLFLSDVCRRLHILDNCAFKLAKPRGETLAKACVEFLVTKNKEGAGRRGRDRGLRPVVKEMAQVLKELAGGGVVKVDMAARSAEVSLRKDLRAVLRGGELHDFARPGCA